MTTPLTEATCTDKLGVLWSPNPEEILNVQGCAEALSECTAAGKSKEKCLKELSAAHDKYEKLVEGNYIFGYFTPAGNRIALLQREKEIDGIRFPVGARVHINKYGKISSAYLPVDTVIKGVNCSKNYIETSNKGQLQTIASKGGVKFYDNGTLEYATLATDQEIGDINFPKGSDLEFKNDTRIHVGNASLSVDTVIQGVNCAKGKVTFYNNGQLKSATLASDGTVIDDVHCAKGDVSFYNNGQLQSTTLASDQEIQGRKFPKGSEIHFPKITPHAAEPNAKSPTLTDEDFDRVAASFPAGPKTSPILTKEDFDSLDAEYDGDEEDLYSLSAKLSADYEIDGIKFGPGALVSFDANGKLESATLATPQEINGIKCDKDYKIGFYKAGLNNNVDYFHARLAEDQEIQGIKFSAGSIIMLDGDNKLRRAILGSDQEIIKNVPLLKGAQVDFDAYGKPESVMLAKPQEINGIKCDKNYGIGFYKIDSNSISYFHARLAEDQEIQGIKFSAGTIIMLDGDNKLRRAILGSDQEVQEITCAAGYLTCFHENGKLHLAKLAEEQVLGGIPLLKDTQVNLDEDGRLSSVQLADYQHIDGKPYQYDTVRFRNGKVVEEPMLGRTYLNAALDYSFIQDRPDITRLGLGINTLLFEKIYFSPKLFFSGANNESYQKDKSKDDGGGGGGGGAGLDVAFPISFSDQAALLFGIGSSVEYTRYRDKLHNEKSEIGVPVMAFLEPQMYSSAGAYFSLMMGFGQYFNITDGSDDAMFQAGLKGGFSLGK